jgi:hypothetical protein
MINLAPVSVSKSADGTTCGIYTVGCTAGTLSPALTGYLGQIGSNGGSNSLFLYIPTNFDGSPRAETRLLSTLVKPSGSTRTNGNGDSISGSSLGLGNLFLDNQNGNAIYGQDQNNKRIWKLIYNESYPGCAGYVSYHPYPASGDYNTGVAPVTDDCFTWTVITPLAGGRDVRTQVMGTAGNNGGYQTGLNYLGQTVGQTHTGFDLGWMTNTGTSIGADAGFITISIGQFQNGPGAIASFADDGSGTYVLKSVHDTWSEPGLRWGGDHAIPLTDMGTFRFGSVDPLEETGNSSLVFNGRNRATVSQVNRAGFGLPTAWDSATSLTSNTDYYPCPTGLPAPYTSFSGTTNCIQVRVNTPFCQIAPNSTYTFPDGKHEAAEFPCTTPGFGVANASYSKLQDIQGGDWLASDLGNFGERFVVLTSPVYNSATDITFWLLRTAGSLYLAPNYNGAGDETGGVGHSAGGQPCCTHANGWYLYAIPTIATGVATLDVSSPSNTWLADNPFRFSGHGSAGRGTSAGLYSFSQGGSACPAHSYCGGANLTPMQHITSNLANLATEAPSFAGISGIPIDAMLQSYSSATQNAGVSPYPFFVDFRHINPAGPSTTEALNFFGNTFSLTPVAGTSKTYLVSADCCVPSPDYKRWGLQAYAGRFWMKDASGPTTFGSAADMPDWSVCLARNVNECVFGSSAGQRYVTVPKHDIQPQCSSSAFGLAVPCVSAFGPWTGQTVQYRIDKYEPTGLMSRKFGFVHAHLGLHYAFSNCRPTPDGQFMFCPGYWLDGVRTEWLALRIGAQPPIDNVNRTTFVPIIVNYQGVPFASNIRARFGYAENGGDLLRCTAYGQDCSTEIPSGSPGDPFSFSNEPATRQACVNGANCTITIPSLANRILYYVVDRLDSGGSIVETSPMQAVAVP